jgi:hypothetical protein
MGDQAFFPGLSATFGRLASSFFYPHLCLPKDNVPMLLGIGTMCGTVQAGRVHTRPAATIPQKDKKIRTGGTIANRWAASV